ncbi:hypothetical protein Tco_0899531, partial [Tanacetum coccineum]
VAFDLLRDALSAIFGLSELKARSWSIPSEDPYEEAARQLLEQAPRSPEYVPDPMELGEVDTPPRKRLLLTTPRPSREVGESSAAAAARQPRPTMAHRVNYSLINTMETRFRDTKRRMMTALEMVNIRVSYQVDVRSRESSEFHLRHHDAQKIVQCESFEMKRIEDGEIWLTSKRVWRTVRPG